MLPVGYVYENGGAKSELDFAAHVADTMGSHVASGAVRNVEEYMRICQVGEGSHGVVYKAQVRVSSFPLLWFLILCFGMAGQEIWP